MEAKERIAKFEKRRQKLSKMSDDDLKKRFWELCHQAVAPMVDLSKTHTSPSIERSVLMRMGIDTFTSQAVVIKVTEAGLLGKGAGNCLLKVSEKSKLTVVEAAKQIAEDKAQLKDLF